MSIALLDLNGVTSLSGNAIYGTSYSLEYNTVSKNYEFSVTPDADANISVESATGISYVVLFPNEDYDVALQCKKDDKNYEYVFRNGIAANKVYYRAEQNGDVSCLPWTEYKDNSGEDGGDEGGNEEIIDGKVRLFAEGVTPTSGWYDVNKIDYSTDINMCWAATSSNIIQWWQDRYMAAGNTLPAGAISGKGTSSYELALMDMYKEQWDNTRGADASHGITWYFEGRNIQQYATAGSCAQPLSGNDGGYFANIWNEILPHVYHDYSYVIAPGIIEFNNL
ncbi:MAG: IdeS/Mac family cysteine endopeptidase, partial [Bacteroidales bacterium]|nr:IdeS/Mac family cysteine endopeptidase [Bacteroidales bacterium]